MCAEPVANPLQPALDLPQPLYRAEIADDRDRHRPRWHLAHAQLDVSLELTPVLASGQDHEAASHRPVVRVLLAPEALAGVGPAQPLG
jgi:hypothetical protein